MDLKLVLEDMLSKYVLMFPVCLEQNRYNNFFYLAKPVIQLV